jgi:hypothetical protein
MHCIGAEAWWRTAEAGLQTLRGPKCSHQMLHARGSSTARQITSSELSKYVCHERLTSYMLRIM